MTQVSDSGISHPPPPSTRGAVAAPAPTRRPEPTASALIEQPGKQALGNEYVQTDGGALIHRVSRLCVHSLRREALNIALGRP